MVSHAHEWTGFFFLDFEKTAAGRLVSMSEELHGTRLSFPSQEKHAAIFVFSSPRGWCWCLDLQLCLDLFLDSILKRGRRMPLPPRFAVVPSLLREIKAVHGADGDLRLPQASILHPIDEKFKLRREQTADKTLAEVET